MPAVKQEISVHYMKGINYWADAYVFRLFQHTFLEVSISGDKNVIWRCYVTLETLNFRQYLRKDFGIVEINQTFLV